jgi:hypothetical protein
MTWNTNENEHIAEYEENDSTSFRHTYSSNSNNIDNTNSEQGLKGMIIMTESLIVGRLLRMTINFKRQ